VLLSLRLTLLDPGGLGLFGSASASVVADQRLSDRISK
jgi:hypothetical protein